MSEQSALSRGPDAKNGGPKRQRGSIRDYIGPNKPLCGDGFAQQWENQRHPANPNKCRRRAGECDRPPAGSQRCGGTFSPADPSEEKGVIGGSRESELVQETLCSCPGDGIRSPGAEDGERKRHGGPIVRYRYSCPHLSCRRPRPSLQISSRSCYYHLRWDGHQMPLAHASVGS